LKAHAGSGASVVQDLRFLVEFLADPVAAEFTHHAVAPAFRVLLDDRTHVAEKGSGANSADAQHMHS